VTKTDEMEWVDLEFPNFAFENKGEILGISPCCFPSRLSSVGACFQLCQSLSLNPDVVRNGGGVIEPGRPDHHNGHERSGHDAGEAKAVQ
jgi:hypothetical protein